MAHTKQIHSRNTDVSHFEGTTRVSSDGEKTYPGNIPS